MLVSGVPELAAVTRASLGPLAPLAVEEVALDDWWPEEPAGRQGRETGREPLDGIDDPSAAVWTLLLVEGEQVDACSLVAALASGTAAARPQVVSAPSAVPDPFLWLQPRLRRGRVSVNAFLPSVHDVDTGAPAEASGGERGTPWSLHAPPAASRAVGAASEWARRAAVAVTQRQAETLEGPSPFTASLLLLAGQWDAVLSRATAALNARCPAQVAVLWARVAVAAACCGERWAEAEVFLERWAAVEDTAEGRGLLATWRVEVGLARDDPAPAGERVTALVADPWASVRARAAARQKAEAAAEVARRIMAEAARGVDPDQLVEWWRRAGLDPGELVRRWPGNDVSALYRGLVACDGRSARWWLGIAEAIHAVTPFPEVVVAAARLAARVDAGAAVRWTAHATRLGLPGPHALQQRAEDPALDPVERVVAAACAGSLAVAPLGLIGEAVEHLHAGDALRVLLAVDESAPQHLPEVIRRFCSDDERTSAMQAALRRVGAGEQADALGELLEAAPS